MKLSLPQIALRRPITVTMLAVTMLCMGAIAASRIPLEFLPGMELPFVICVIPYPGATPEQVENEIAIPAEGAFRTLPGLQRIRTTSDTNGCTVHLDFDWDVNMGLATAETRDRMERLRLELPSGVDNIYLQRFSAQSMPVMLFALFSDEDREEFAHRIRTYIEPRLMRQEGVAEVAVFGGDERQVLVEFDQDALRSANLALYDVVSRLQNSSINVALGSLYEARSRYYVRALGEFSTPDELADLVIGPNNMRLRHVAEVGYGSRSEDEGEYTVDGMRGVFLFVRKESQANTVDTCEAVRTELEAILAEPEFQGTEKFIFFDQSEIILGALDGLFDAGRYGGALALGVLFIFLLRIRPTLVVALVIPASLLGGLVFMFFAGMSLNLVTMTSMIIAVGMLVDNSIVVMENIYRHRQLGHGPVESAHQGASEVGLAITTATCTTLVVFIPVLFMEAGQMSHYMQQFAGPVMVALVTSLVLALTVIPLAASRMRERRALPGYAAASRLLSGFTGARKQPRPGGYHPIQRLIAIYMGCLSLTLRWRMGAMLVVLAIATLTSAIPYQHVGVADSAPVSAREVNIRVTLDQNYDMDGAREVFERLEQAINAQREELGIKNVFLDYSRRGGQISVYLMQPDDYAPGERRKYSTEEVRDILWQRLPDKMPGVELRFSIPDMGEGEGRSVTVRMRGDDTRLLNEYAERFRDIMEGIPNLTEVETDTDRSRQEMQLRIDNRLAAEANVTPIMLAQTVDFALRGTRLPYLKQGGREIPVWAQFREEHRQTRANLDNVAILTPTGQFVTVNQIAEYQRAQSPRAIRRIDGKNVVSISGQVSGDNMLQIQRDIRQAADGFQMPQGYNTDLGDEFQEMQENIVNFINTLLLAIILIYIVMGALFESYILPLSILTSVPLAFIGVYWALYFTGTSWDIVAFIGVILMVGIVVNNGIVIVDYINQLRKQGFDRTTAILQAGRNRFRPVFMTAITTILGCVPLAIADSETGASFNSLGWALIGGLTTGTALTLFIVPLFYTFIDDIGGWLRNFFASVASLGGGASAGRA
jgi:hydrophobic/amphiphilic exporter-1 (mainly G- bacteria), HAE1 family